MHDIGIDLEGGLGNYNIGRLLQRSHLFIYLFFLLTCLSWYQMVNKFIEIIKNQV